MPSKWQNYAPSSGGNLLAISKWRTKYVLQNLSDICEEHLKYSHQKADQRIGQGRTNCLNIQSIKSFISTTNYIIKIHDYNYFISIINAK